ncbi:MAG: hypothetical protein M1839_000460 [Geoglossum umbratile]|nr:MAG: hypothetical protein M1839_000460 [Geoglossum umbratile]
MGDRLDQEDRLHADSSTAGECEYEDEQVRPALNTDTFDKTVYLAGRMEAQDRLSHSGSYPLRINHQSQSMTGQNAAVTQSHFIARWWSMDSGSRNKLQNKERKEKEIGNAWKTWQEELAVKRGHVTWTVVRSRPNSSSNDNGNSRPSNKADWDKDNGTTWRRQSSSCDGPMSKKHKLHLQQKSTVRVDE